MMRNIGRHRGRDLEKQVLDILSYEARAAVHRCYSCVWSDLIPVLSCEAGLSVESLRFLQLWHQEWVSESDLSQTDRADFHLFHGHLFAVHPATATLARTATGRRLIGEYLVAPTPEARVEPFRRLLAAVNLALHAYRGRRELHREERRKRPHDAGEGGCEASQERQLTHRDGRLRPRPATA